MMPRKVSMGSITTSPVPSFPAMILMSASAVIDIGTEKIQLCLGGAKKIFFSFFSKFSFSPSILLLSADPQKQAKTSFV